MLDRLLSLVRQRPSSATGEDGGQGAGLAEALGPALDQAFAFQFAQQVLEHDPPFTRHVEGAGNVALGGFRRVVGDEAQDGFAGREGREIVGRAVLAGQRLCPVIKK